jgi:hypothetical protein
MKVDLRLLLGLTLLAAACAGSDDDDSGVPPEEVQADDDDSALEPEPRPDPVEPTGSVACAPPMELAPYQWRFRWGSVEYPAEMDILMRHVSVAAPVEVLSYTGIVEAAGDAGDGSGRSYIRVVEVVGPGMPPALDPDIFEIWFELPGDQGVPVVVGQRIQAELAIRRLDEGSVVTSQSLWGAAPRVRRLIALFEYGSGGPAHPAGDGDLLDAIEPFDGGCPAPPSPSCSGVRTAAVDVWGHPPSQLGDAAGQAWRLWPGSYLPLATTQGEFMFGVPQAWIFDSGSDCPHAERGHETSFFLVSTNYAWDGG